MADKLSPENLQKLGKIIDDAKGLMAQQLEILDKVLLAEEKIANTRIGHLTRYFDVYSAGLDKVANKHSDLDEALIVANKEAEKFLAYMGSSGGGNGGGGNVKNVTSGRPSGKDSAVSNGDNTELTREDIKGATEEELTKAKEARREATSLLAELLHLNELRHEEERDEAIKSYRATVANENKKDAFDEALDKKRVERWEALGKKQKSITDAIIELHNLQNESAIEKEDRITAIRLNRQQAVLDAEINAANLINQYNAEIQYASNPDNADEIGGNRARQVEAQEDAKSIEALEKKKAEYIASLEYKARRKNNGKLSCRVDAVNVSGGVSLCIAASLSLFDSLIVGVALVHLAEDKVGGGVEYTVDVVDACGTQRRADGTDDGHTAAHRCLKQEGHVVLLCKSVEDVTFLGNKRLVGGDEAFACLEGAACDLKGNVHAADSLSDQTNVLVLLYGGKICCHQMCKLTVCLHGADQNSAEGNIFTCVICQNLLIVAQQVGNTPAYCTEACDSYLLHRYSPSDVR